MKTKLRVVAGVAVFLAVAVLAPAQARDREGALAVEVYHPAFEYLEVDGFNLRRHTMRGADDYAVVVVPDRCAESCRRELLARITQGEIVRTPNITFKTLDEALPELGADDASPFREHARRAAELCLERRRAIVLSFENPFVGS